MQFPNAEIDLFIVIASLLWTPSLPVLDILSDPAKSTIVNNPFL
jgi:hypothetical protein